MSRFMPAVMLAALLCSSVGLADWPVSRGNSTMTGVAPPNPIPFPEQLEEKWTFKTNDTIEGAPAIVNGVVYVASLDKHLYALDLATGKQKWKVKLSYMKASPCVKGDRVYVGDLDGTFHCVKASDGSKVWDFQTDGEIMAGCNFHGDNVLIGSHDATLYCLDKNGKKVWDVKTDGPVNGSAAVIGDLTFVAGCDSILHVLDARTGKEQFAVDLEGQAAATAAIAGDRAFVGTMANTLVAVDLKKKERVWKFEAPRRQQPFYGSAAVQSGIVVAGSRDKKVYGIDTNTGEQKWVFETDGQVDCSPAVVGNRVYIGSLSSDGLFYVLDLKTGKKLQEIDLDSAITGSVSVGPDCILVGTEKGTLYCLGKK